jgi:hypothetical protein
MVNIIGLLRGTQRILPVGLNNYQGLKIESVKETPFIGTKMKVYNVVVRSSEGNKAYNVMLAFYGLEDPTTEKGSMSESRIGIRCGCQAYYFWFSWANMKNKASFGARFKPYVRKTPASDPRYPPKNPKDIPGMCKHLILTQSVLNTVKAITA